MKVVIFGPTGQLGTDVVRVFIGHGEDVVPVTHDLADLTDRAAVQDLLARERPDAVEIARHFTIPSDARRTRSWPSPLTPLVGALSPAVRRDLGEAHDREHRLRLRRHQMGGYREEDAPNPLNRYGESKLAGEQLAHAAHAQTFVVRTQSLFGLTGPRGKGSNFVDLMLRLAAERDELKVDGFRMAPTGTVALAENMHTLLLTNEFGLYHMSCQGETSWYEFARAILERAGSTTRVTPVSNGFDPTTFKRPENTYLIDQALQARGLDHIRIGKTRWTST